jgi:hypothetical protein
MKISGFKCLKKKKSCEEKDYLVPYYPTQKVCKVVKIGRFSAKKRGFI